MSENVKSNISIVQLVAEFITKIVVITRRFFMYIRYNITSSIQTFFVTKIYQFILVTYRVPWSFVRREKCLLGKQKKKFYGTNKKSASKDDLKWNRKFSSFFLFIYNICCSKVIIYVWKKPSFNMIHFKKQHVKCFPIQQPMTSVAIQLEWPEVNME